MAEEKDTELGEPFDLNSLALVENEILQGFRIVKINNFRNQPESEIKITIPTVEEDAQASRLYTETYNELLLSDKKILTRDEMEEKLKERGLWGQKQEDEIEQIEERITNVMREGQEMHYKKKVNKNRLKELKNELIKLREKKGVILGRKQSFMSQTIEALAEMASLEYKIAKCSLDSTNQPLWADYESFKKENNRFVLNQLIRECLVFWNGLPQDILSRLPEDVMLQGATSEQSQEAPSGA
jgi:hypothetical protein